MCNNFPVYVQIRIVTWHLIGLHDNHNNIITLLVAAILDLQIFNFFHIQIQIQRKQHLAIGICKIVRSIVKLPVFRRK